MSKLFSGVSKAPFPDSIVAAAAEAVTRMRVRQLSKRFAPREEEKEGERRRGCCNLKRVSSEEEEEEWRCERDVHGEDVGEKAIELKLGRRRENLYEMDVMDRLVYCSLIFYIICFSDGSRIHKEFVGEFW